MPTQVAKPTNTQSLFPMSIDYLKQKSYPGSAVTLEQTLVDSQAYKEYLASYYSEGLKVYALLGIPQGQSPSGGWPVILINHGYIPPKLYSPTQSYRNIADFFARSGYVVFMPSYRGNGDSQGEPTQVYVSEGYVIDSENALSSIKQFPGVNSHKIGVFGHSMGGNITLHELVIKNDFKASVIWSGVVGSYSDILTWWQQRRETGVLITQNDQQTADLVDQFFKIHKTPQTNPVFWNSIDPTNYLSNIQSPIEIDVGTNDSVVPVSFSETLRDKLLKLGKNVSFHLYDGADHNLSPSQQEALQTTISFFNTYLK